MYKQIELTQLKENFTDLLKNHYALVTAGDSDAYNMMTISWGAAGELWGRDMITAYIRPQRYTEEFMNKQDYFTVSFYPDSMKKTVHGVCGSKSGRDVDKAKETGLTPVFDEKAPYFAQAEIVIVCKKFAKGEFKPQQFIDSEIDEKWYPLKDYHYIYYGAVEKVLILEK